MDSKPDNTPAGAVRQYTRTPKSRRSSEGREGLGMLAHEMRNFLNTAILAIAAMKAGGAGFSGATSSALDRSLIGMRDLIDRTLAEVRLGEAQPPLRELIELAPFVDDVEVGARLEAAIRGCELTVAAVELGVFVEGDRHMIAAALANLLQNAFKFTRPHSHVFLRAYATERRVFIEVQDECGGLPEGKTEEIFRPFEQSGADRSGVGLGLPISRKAVEASGGQLSVRNIPGTGCVFTIELPRKSAT